MIERGGADFDHCIFCSVNSVCYRVKIPVHDLQRSVAMVIITVVKSVHTCMITRGDCVSVRPSVPQNVDVSACPYGGGVRASVDIASCGH